MADEKELNEEEQEMTVTLTLDDDTEVECVVLTVFNAGEHEYIALLPMEGADSEEGEVYLYRYFDGAVSARILPPSEQLPLSCETCVK